MIICKAMQKKGAIAPFIMNFGFQLIVDCLNSFSNVFR